MNPTYLTELCESTNALLVVVDLQGKIFELAFNHGVVKRRADQLLRLADLFRVPVLLTEQYPRGLGHTDPDLLAIFQQLCTEKHLLEKTSFGCCGDPAFGRVLADVAGRVCAGRGAGEPGRPVDVVLAGIETHVCVLQTVLELLRREYRVVVLEDVTGCREKINHRNALQRLRQAGAIISNFESLTFEWMRTKDHRAFKQVSALVKEG